MILKIPIFLVLLLNSYEITTKVDSNHLDYLQEARQDYFNKRKIKGIVTNININFYKEIKENQNLKITTNVVYISEKSFKLKQIIYHNNFLISDAIVTVVRLQNK